MVRQRASETSPTIARSPGSPGPTAATSEMLKPFAGKRVGGVELLADPDVIERLFDAGELDFLEYQSF